MSARRALVRRAAGVGVVLAVALVAWSARRTHGVWLAPGPGVPAPWTLASTDPDGQYHMRRLERALAEGGRVAPRDPRLDAPRDEERGGAAIPWPPYATHLLWAVAAPFAPSEPEPRAAFVEGLVARWPLACGVATAALVALVSGAAARRAARARGPGTAAIPIADPIADPGPDAVPGATASVLAVAAVAGLLAALPPASLRASGLGNGDHHAFVTLLHVGLAAVLARGLREVRAGRGSAARTGVLAGALGAAVLGTWSASLLWLGLLDLALWASVAWPVARGGGDPPDPDPGSARRRADRAVGRLGVWACATAALGLVPAVWGGAWGGGELLEPSWAQVALLSAGAVVHGPLAARGRAGLGWAAVLALGAGLALVLLGGAELRAGLHWASGREAFMASINESQPVPLARLGAWVSHGLWALPLAAAALAVGAWRRGDAGALVWLVPLPALVLLALAQRRFGEALVPWLAVGVAVGGVAPLLAAARRVGSGACAGLAVVLVGLAAGANPGPLATVVRDPLGAGGDGGAGEVEEGPTRAHLRGVRELAVWLRDAPPRAADGEEPLVVAQWDLGHTLEWVGRCRTVASNFGTYLGRASYVDPWRVLASTDDAGAEALLRERDATHVVVTSRWTRNLPAMAAALAPEVDAVSLTAGEPGREGWRRTLAARLTATASADAPPTPGFLRLVHLSPRGLRDRAGGGSADPPPHGRVWEVVEGAWVELAGAPGDELVVRARAVFPDAGHTELWTARATVGEDGLARVRAPYADLRWEHRAGDAVRDAGELRLEPDAVRRGTRVRVGG